MRIWLDKTVDQEFADLGTTGATGTLNDRQFTYLRNHSYTGSLADMIHHFIYGVDYTVADIEPDLVFDFEREYYRTNGLKTTFEDALTFTRASNASYVNSIGAIQTASTNVARRGHYSYEGGEWVNKGVLLEGQATNLLLNSGTLSTQNVTVTAVPHTLHFTGTGTITLSGASTAGPLVGTGSGESNRVSLTFTPTAGSLTLTVAGTVTNAQLEAGTTATSYIATAGATATRAADVVSGIDLTGMDLSAGYTLVVRGQLDGVAGNFDRVVQLDTGSDLDRHLVFWSTSGERLRAQMFSADISQSNYDVAGGPQLGQSFEIAMAAGSDHFQGGRNGEVSSLDSLATYTQPTTLRLAQSVSGNKPARLLLSQVLIYPALFDAATLAEVTT